MTFADPAAIRDHIDQSFPHLRSVPEAPSKPFFQPYVWRPPSEIPRREFLYGRHYIRRFTSATFAPGGYGKSNLLMTECMCMASGRGLLGVTPDERLRAAFWNGEDPLEETERRVAAVNMRYGLQAEDLEGWFFWGSGRDQDLVIAEQTSAVATLMRPNIERVKEAIRECRLDVLTIDPFVSCHRVEENNNNGVDVVAEEWGKIAQDCNISVELSHHTTKAAISRDVRVEDGRGGGALLFAVRSARILNVMTEDEAGRADVEPEKRRSYFRVSYGKANLSRPTEKSDWFHFHSEDLGNGGGLRPGDNVGVVEPWDWPRSAREATAPRVKLNHAAQRILEAYWRLVDDGQTVPAPKVPGVPSGQSAVPNDDLKRMAVRLTLVSAPMPSVDRVEDRRKWNASTARAWERGCAKLIEKRRLRFEDGFVWHISADRGGGGED